MAIKLGSANTANVSLGTKQPAPQVKQGLAPAQPKVSTGTAQQYRATMPQLDEREVSIYLDPSTNEININAPQYLVDSPEFQNEILPQFERLKGQVITDTDFNAIMNSGALKDIQTASEAVRQRRDFINEYKLTNNGSTDDDAMLFYRNKAASYQSNNDQATQFVLGSNEDGSDRTVSVKDLYDTYKSMDKKQLASAANQLIIDANKDTTSPRDKAIKLSLVDFMREKKLLTASTSDKINAAMTSFLSKIDKAGAVGWLSNQVTRIGNDGGASAQARRDLDTGVYQNLEGTDAAMALGDVGASLTGIIGDVVAGNAIGGAVSSGAGATRAGRAISTALGSSTPGRTARTLIEQAPKDIAFGTLQAINNREYNPGQGFVLDTAINAGALGVARGANAAAKAIDSASNGAIHKLSTEIARTGYRGLDMLQSLPGIGGLMKKASTKFLDDSAALSRTARNAFAKDAGAENFYYQMSNAARQSAQRGIPETQVFLDNSPQFKQALDANRAINDLAPDALEKANRYVVDRTLLDRIEAGQYNASPSQIEEITKRMQDNYAPEFDEYRDALSALNDDITQLSVDLGVVNEDIIDYMLESKDYAQKYIHLQFDLSRDNAYSGPVNAGYSLKSSQVGKRIKGLTDAEALDPLLVATERLQALNELAARNRVTTLLKEGIDNGWVSGEVVQDALQVRERGAIKAAIKAERKVVDQATTDIVEQLNDDLLLLTDDLEDIFGSGRAVLESRIDTYIDEMAEAVAADEGFNLITRRVANTAEDVSDRQVALEALSLNKKRIGKLIEEQLQNSDLGKDGRARVVEIFEDRLNAITSRELNGVTSGLADNYDELRKLNADIVPSNETKGQDVLAYFDRGGKGYIRVADPDVVDYFNTQRSYREDGWIAKLMTGASRAFRAGTTGLNPRFVLVNAARDVPQSAVLSGYGAISPRQSMVDLLTTRGMDERTARQFVEQANREFQSSFKYATEYASARNPQQGYQKLVDQDKRNMSTQGKEGAARVAGRLKRYVIDAVHPRKAIRNAEDFFGEAELLTRRNVFTSRFDAALKRGQSVEDALQEALFYASETTTNFLRAGSRVRQIIRTMPYLSAAINGKASFMRLWALDPVGVTTRLATGIAAPAIYLTAQNLANPEFAEGYWEIPDYTRETNFIIMTGPDSYISIPMSYELASVVNPFRETIEGAYGMNDSTLAETITDAFLNSSPIDLSGFTEEDMMGRTDYKRAIARTAGAIMPQLFRPLYEGATNTDLYTGNPIGPTDEELYRRGDVAPGEDITNADRTFASRNSRVLGAIANAIGIPQSTIQNTFESYTGQVGSFLLNMTDKLIGAPEEEQGGKDFAESVANTFLGTPAGRANRDYYAGINALEAEKERLQTRLTRLNNEGYGADDGGEAVNLTRQQLIDEYGQRVADFADKFGEYYQRVGGFKPYQIDSLVKLLNFGPAQGAFDSDSYQSGELQDARNEASNEANRRAADLGLPTTNMRDLFGQTLQNDLGVNRTEWDDTTLGTANFRSRVYGAPKQAAYDFAQIVKANKQKGIESMFDVQSRYYNDLNKLYEEARGLKGKAAQEVYSRINALQEKYMTEEFDTRIKPLIDKYGPEILMNNKQIFDEISSYIMVPGDYTPFFSKKKQPYLEKDVEAYLRDRYGVGNYNQQNLPTDDEARIIINQVNADLANGRISSATRKLSDLESDVEAGQLYVDPDTMEDIRRMLQARNSYR